MKEMNIYKLLTIILSITTVALIVAYTWLYFDTRVQIDNFDNLSEEKLDYSKINVVEINNDNWQDYIEMKEAIKPYYDQFDELAGMIQSPTITLKNEYSNKLVKDSTIVYQLRFSCEYKQIQIDINNLSYKIIKSDSSSYRLSPLTDTVTYTPKGDNSSIIFGNYIFFDSARENNIIANQEICKFEEMQKIKGTLYISK